MKDLSVMIKPASSACNMRCRYCFYEDVSRRREAAHRGMMTDGTARAVLDSLFAALGRGDKLHLSFQGGEPTLRGLEFYRGFFDAARKRAASQGVTVSYGLQTNGLMLDDEWCAFLSENRVLVGLSLDALEDVHDALRPDASGRGTWKPLKAVRRRLQAHGVDYNVVSVLSKPLSRHPELVWRFITSEHIDFIQFIPCLGPLDGADERWALAPEDFAGFYTALFGAWLQAFQKGEYHSIKLFDDLYYLIGRGEVHACGLTGVCAPQLVVEADGDVYPCDFYALDAWRVGNLAREPLDRILSSPVRAAFAARDTARPEACAGCPYVRLCGGGCPRQRGAVCLRPGDRRCGYRLLLDNIVEPLSGLARGIPARR